MWVSEGVFELLQKVYGVLYNLSIRCFLSRKLAAL
jgi:hypothetical protein